MYTSHRNAIQSHIIDNAKKVVKDGAKEILKEAKDQTPVDDEELIGSAAISEQETATSLELYVHFGSNPVSSEYAVIQHENPFYNHPNGGNYKFLENPFNAIAPSIISNVKASK